MAAKNEAGEEMIDIPWTQPLLSDDENVAGMETIVQSSSQENKSTDLPTAPEESEPPGDEASPPVVPAAENSFSHSADDGDSCYETSLGSDGSRYRYSSSRNSDELAEPCPNDENQSPSPEQEGQESYLDGAVWYSSRSPREESPRVRFSRSTRVQRETEVPIIRTCLWNKRLELLMLPVVFVCAGINIYFLVQHGIRAAAQRANRNVSFVDDSGMLNFTSGDVSGKTKGRHPAEIAMRIMVIILFFCCVCTIWILLRLVAEYRKLRSRRRE